MLNIPDEAKALFKRDDIYKNFRVHFPNGEYRNLGNDDVVTESVSFTESLCSQQAFRFGLTEASELKFTAVGIPNIRGVTIEAAIDIDVSSLGAAWINQRSYEDAQREQAGTLHWLDCRLGDNVHLPDADYITYRIPFGRFIVDTCPRNHESMWKREVTAYAERLEESFVNPFQISLMNSFFPNMDTYTFNLKPMVYSVMYRNDPDSLISKGYTKTSVSNGLDQTQSTTLSLKTTGGQTKSVKFSYSYREYLTLSSPHPTSLYEPQFMDGQIPDVLNGAIEALEDLGINATASGYASLSAIVEYAFPVRNHFVSIMPDSSQLHLYGFVEIPHDSTLIYPYAAEADRLFLCSMSSVSIANETDGVYIYSEGFPAVTFSEYSDNNSAEIFAQMQLSFNSTLQTKKKFGQTVVNYSSFANAFSLSDMVRGFLELQCRFGSPARTGGLEITELDSTSPISINPSEYSSLWYDETVISPIGYVEIKFKDESGSEQDITVQIGSGASVYDLRDNEVLSNLAFSISQAEAESGVTIESKIIAFLNSVFTPNIPDLTFVPIELEKKGLPYLEAGDAIEVETEDSQTVPSFILRQTIKGIQFLEADVESSNGEAMEMIE